MRKTETICEKLKELGIKEVILDDLSGQIHIEFRGEENGEAFIEIMNNADFSEEGL